MYLFTYAIIVSGFLFAVEEAQLASFDIFSHRDDPRHGEMPCHYRRTPGVCKRRTECRKPTRRICRFGLVPIVCCLDKPVDEVEEAPIIFPESTDPPPRPIFVTVGPSRPIIFPESTDPPPRPIFVPVGPSKPPVGQSRPPSRTRPRPTPKPPAIEDINLYYPGCGSRPSSVSQTARQTEESGSTSRRLGRKSRFRGKRRISDELIRPKRQIRPVVVGGRESIPNSWPWMAAIFKTATPGAKRRFLCGGSLISPQYILSAAHCFDTERGNIDPSKFSVNLGAHDTRGGEEYPVQSIKVHSSYKSKLYYNDLSLLKLSKEALLTFQVYPVCIPAQPPLQNRIVARLNVTVTGWGDTAFGGVQSKVLQEVQIPVVSLKECNESYSKVAKSTFPEGITDKFICAGEKEGGKDACQGDSGGPLVMEVRKNKWEQLGVVSFGYGCAQPGYPGVYTRVAKYRQWIYENTDLGKD